MPTDQEFEYMKKVIFGDGSRDYPGLVIRMDRIEQGISLTRNLLIVVIAILTVISGYLALIGAKHNNSMIVTDKPVVAQQQTETSDAPATKL